MNPHRAQHSERSGRVPAATAVSGTVLIAFGAFWLSFTALADLARRSGIDEHQAWAWPLIVDGVIVCATVAVVALAGTRQSWYPWMLLILGAGLSVSANAVHAIVAADQDVPAPLAAAVAAVPPLILLAITHLTVILTRHRPIDATHTQTIEHLVAEVQKPEQPTEQRPIEVSTLPEPHRSTPGREVAVALRHAGWSNKRIARELGVHPSTVGRWWHNTESEEITPPGVIPDAPQQPNPGIAATPAPPAEVPEDMEDHT